ncbi:hypothetical protein CHELA40_40242 [Chelatococcus asaccharovorans]|nr:hypothetical protein CHELA40_40242 [Chelatococcus asaccharovorans]
MPGLVRAIAIIVSRGVPSPWIREPYIWPAPCGYCSLSIRGNCSEQLLEHLLGLSCLLDGLGLVEIHRLADDDERDHAHTVVWRAFDAVDSLLVEGHGDLFIHLALEGFGPVGEHPLDAFGVVRLVSRDEGDGVAGRGNDEVGLEHHCAFLAFVEHLDLMVGGLGGAGQQKTGERGRDGDFVSHDIAFPLMTDSTVGACIGPTSVNDFATTQTDRIESRKGRIARGLQ